MSSVEDLEVLKTLGPNIDHLKIVLTQKFAFDFCLGIYLATAGMNLYGVFDFITFQETIENYSNDDEHHAGHYEFQFAMQANAKLCSVIYACG